MLKLIVSSLLVLAATLPAAFAGEKELPVPRFVSLRAEEANLRTGPGVRYPVEWVFVRRNMPVEIVDEHETWRRIRDAEGTTGWVHQSMLSGKRSFLVTAERTTIRRSPSPDAAVVAVAESGVVGALSECQGQWCRVEAQGLKGWLARADIWGAYPGEVVK